MTTSWQTEQEAFWNGDFGDEYVDRNQGAELMASRTHLFSNALKSAGEVGSAVEFVADGVARFAGAKYPVCRGVRCVAG